MSKVKIAYACKACGGVSPKWLGQCNDCQSWNTLVEVPASTANGSKKKQGYAPITAAASTRRLSEITAQTESRISTGMQEYDRVLGGGLVPGSVVLIGGDPGIGKSTLLLQILCTLSQQYSACYVTGEESLEQVALRARRLKLPQTDLQVLSETHVERILAMIHPQRPKLLVIDSIQTIHTDQVPSAPGSVGQVRESTRELIFYAKQQGTVVFLIGHVTKEGHLAGPKVLEHMVDTVLYFEGAQDQRFRLIRTVKNRFGAVNELGIFAMTEQGIRGMNQPSAMFLSHYATQVSGSSVMVSWEGSRPLLLEVQALVDESYLAHPKRVTLGLEGNRLSMLLAVLHRHTGITTYNQDIFINVVGGMRITETAADVPLLLAIISSLRNRPLPRGLVAFGEVGLAGEIRPVQGGQERLQEAAKHGFESVILPQANAPKKPSKGMIIKAVQSIQEVMAILNEEL